MSSVCVEQESLCKSSKRLKMLGILPKTEECTKISHMFLTHLTQIMLNLFSYLRKLEDENCKYLGTEKYSFVSYFLLNCYENKCNNFSSQINLKKLCVRFPV